MISALAWAALAATSSSAGDGASRTATITAAVEAPAGTTTGTTGTSASAPVEPSASSSGVELALPLRGKLRITGFLHVDAALLDERSSDELDATTRLPLNEQRFVIRRARVRMEVDYGLVGGGLELDGNTNDGLSLRLLTAEAFVRWPSAAKRPLVELSVGLLKVPFGVETPSKVRTRLFHDAPLFVRAFFPGEYDLGAQLRGGWRFLRYSLAAMNGDPVSEPRFGARDTTSSKDLMARLGIELGDALRVEAGTSVLWGEGLHPGAAATKDTISWTDANQDGVVDPAELHGVPGTAATPSSTFRRYGVGGDLKLRLTLAPDFDTMAFGELIWGENLDRGTTIADPLTAKRPLHELGLAVGVVQELGPWATLGFRVDRYAGDLETPRLATTNFTIIAAVHWASIAGLSLQYVHQENALKQGANGLFTRLPADTLGIRAKLGF